MPEPNRKLFQAAHYNAIAKDIREELDILRDISIDNTTRISRASALYDLALRLAKRFKIDNEGFNPYVFLDRCSPDPDNIPISELWED